MRASSKYLVAVALLAVFAVAFGVIGTVAPPLVEEMVGPEPQQESSSESVGHFQNPPTYDSGWVDITAKAGQYVTLRHGLNTSEVVVDITGKQSPEPWGEPLAWSKTYGGAGSDVAYSVVQTVDGGYALAGYTNSYGAGSYDIWLVKSDVELGLVRTGLTSNSIILYRGTTDLDWNYVRVRIWTIKEPTWMFGDINQDGVVDAQDLLILSQNYGKTFSLLSLSGIVAVAGIHTYKKRKQPK